MIWKKDSEKYFQDQEKKIKEQYGERYESLKTLAIIKDVRFGKIARGQIALYFTVNLPEGGAAGHYAFYPEYEHYMHMYGIQKLHQLNDKPVFVLNEGMIGKALFPIKPAII